MRFSVFFTISFADSAADHGGRKGWQKGTKAPRQGIDAEWETWYNVQKGEKKTCRNFYMVQARLYRAKNMVDGCVTIALLSVVMAPASQASCWLDFIGSLIVATYLIWCGVRTVYEVFRDKV